MSEIRDEANADLDSLMLVVSGHVTGFVQDEIDRMIYGFIWRILSAWRVVSYGNDWDTPSHYYGEWVPHYPRLAESHITACAADKER